MNKYLLLILIFFTAASVMAQNCSELFISEYVEGSGNNKAIEIYNPTLDAIDLSTYQLVRYSNGSFDPSPVVLSGTIASKGTFVVVLDKRDPNGTGLEQPVDSVLQTKADIFLCPVYEVNKMMYFNGNDAVTLEKITGEIIDIFAVIGPPMISTDNGWGNINDTTITYNSGGNPTEYTITNYIVGPLFWLAWTKDHTLIRKPDVSFGVTANPDPYFVVDTQWDSIPKNTFDSLGFHHCDCTTFAIDENQPKAQVALYPNPVSDHHFTIEADQAIAGVEVYDLTGRKAEVTVTTAGVFVKSVSLGRHFEGVIFVTINFESGQTQTRKLLLK